ncbi:hypothetical protein F511_45171 [Dorcoceras hygrometricum]|uniref:Uncharacterized protein n=1 Tax=Dorcoceras hygrometricum TaxID=472368 RepID=A0A2Z6ZWS9_9LAMI|nr:hypothetical protein F511_45171 [Dorcoceras hygrometricum]
MTKSHNTTLSTLNPKTHAPPLQFTPPPCAAAAGKLVSGQLDVENPFVLILSGLLVQPDEGVSDLVVDRIGDNLPQSTEKSRIIVITVGARHKCQQESKTKIKNRDHRTAAARGGASSRATSRARRATPCAPVAHGGRSFGHFLRALADRRAAPRASRRATLPALCRNFDGRPLRRWSRKQRTMSRSSCVVFAPKLAGSCWDSPRAGREELRDGGARRARRCAQSCASLAPRKILRGDGRRPAAAPAMS